MVRINLQKKIFLYYVLLILIVLGVLGFFFFTQISADLSASIENNLQGRSEEVTNRISSFLDKSFGDIQIMSSNTILRSAQFSIVEKRETLNLFETLGIYDEISLIDFNGNVITSTADDFKSDWEGGAFQNAVNGDVVSFVDDRSLWFLSPIFGGEEIVAARLPLNVLWEITDKIKVGDSGFIFVLDSSGNIVSHPNKEFILKKPPYNLIFNKLLTKGVIEFQDNGNSFIAGYSTMFGERDYKRDEWKIFALQPSNEAFLPLTSLSTTFTLALLLLLVVTLLISFVLSKKIIKPLSKLAGGAKRIAAGEWDYRIDIKSEDEVGEIASLFNEMTEMMKEKELLQKLKGDLQEKIKEMEKMNKLMTGREMEIVKLKKKVKKLEEELKRR